MIEVGRICIKKSGRESGKYCVVLKKIDKNFVLITGPRQLTGVRRRRCNILHLEPTEYTLEVKEEMSDEEITKLFEKENLIKKLNLKKPPATKLKS
jgi:large subunit ribosomal protein L14e